jgi:hypothetical protein
MTEKQIERVKLKIAKYKKELADDKKFWGGYYHDGRGIRYVIPAQYIKISDYKGAVKYFNWFAKNFPDDTCYPIFLFEWTFSLFKCGKLVEAEKKAHRTFFSNTYLLDNFLGKEPLQLEKNESFSWESESLLKHFTYSNKDLEFTAFGEWIETVLQSRTFLDKANNFIEISRQLKIESEVEKRGDLIKCLNEIKYE